MIVIDVSGFYSNVIPWIKMHNKEHSLGDYSTRLYDGNAIDDQILAEILGLTGVPESEDTILKEHMTNRKLLRRSYE
jgi:hypothetical protein